MTRPKSKVKGRTPPMSSMNGDSVNPNIPPDIEWDENDPPVVFSCSQHIEHAPGCDGNCESMIANELQVKLLNEGRAWARIGMNFRGIPAAYQSVTPVPGIHVELFDLQCKIHALMEFIVDEMHIDMEVLEERFRENKYQTLKMIREQNEEGIKKDRAEQALGIVKKPRLFGPDGQPLE